MHSLVLGQTGAGKSTLLKRLITRYRQSGIAVLAFTTVPGDFEGYASEVFYDVGPFLERVFATQRCAIIVDEAGEVTNQSRIRETAPLATRSRHLGHVVHFSAQRASGLVGPLVRDQCSRLYLFRVGEQDASDLAKDWGGRKARAAFDEVADFEEGEYLFVQRFPPRLERRKLDLAAIYNRR